MEHQTKKRWGLLGGLRTDGPSERPPEVTLRNVLAESARLMGKIVAWLAAACLAAGVGYLGWGETGAQYGAAGVAALLGLRVLGPLVLQAIGEWILKA
jgi:hypothetical protein